MKHRLALLWEWQSRDIPLDCGGNSVGVWCPVEVEKYASIGLCYKSRFG